MLYKLYYWSHIIQNSSYKFILSFIVSTICAYFFNVDSAYCMTSEDGSSEADYKKLYEESQALIAEHRRMFAASARDSFEAFNAIQVLRGEYERMEAENHQLINHTAQLENTMKRLIEENQALRKYINDISRTR